MAHTCDGNGALFTLGANGSSFTGVVTSISGVSQYRDSIDNTGLTSTNELFCAGKLIRHDTVEVEFFNDDVMDSDLLISAANEVVTITAPLATGAATSRTITGTGFIERITEPSYSNGANPAGSLTWRFTGADLAVNVGT